MDFREFLNKIKINPIFAKMNDLPLILDEMIGDAHQFRYLLLFK